MREWSQKVGKRGLVRDGGAGGTKLQEKGEAIAYQSP